jgi:hypothetical protein
MNIEGDETMVQICRGSTSERLAHVPSKRGKEIANRKGEATSHESTVIDVILEKCRLCLGWDETTLEVRQVSRKGSSVEPFLH